jgi:predicted metalloprotease
MVIWVGYERTESTDGEVNYPESHAHGLLRQRLEWFFRGYRSGKPNMGDPFSVNVYN